MGIFQILIISKFDFKFIFIAEVIPCELTEFMMRPQFQRLKQEQLVHGPKKVEK